jgi:regulator of replication initiation timing
MTFKNLVLEELNIKELQANLDTMKTQMDNLMKQVTASEEEKKDLRNKYDNLSKIIQAQQAKAQKDAMNQKQTGIGTNKQVGNKNIKPVVEPQANTNVPNNMMNK